MSSRDRALRAAGIAKYGTFNAAGAFTRLGDLTTTNYTVEVENGALLRP